MNCPSCGHENLGVLSFCSACGETFPLSDGSAEKASAEPESEPAGASRSNRAYAPPEANLLTPVAVAHRRLNRRVRIAAGAAAIRGVFSSSIVFWLAVSEPEGFGRLLEDHVFGARIVGLIISGVLEVVCAPFLWWRHSLVAAYVLVAYSSFDAIYKYTLDRNPLSSLAFAVLYAVAIHAIEELRKLPEESR